MPCRSTSFQYDVMQRYDLPVISVKKSELRDCRATKIAVVRIVYTANFVRTVT